MLSADTEQCTLLYEQERLEIKNPFFFFFCPLQSNPKLRDSTSAPTPLLQRNGSGGGGQAAGQLGTGTPGTGSMGPSPHMMRRGKSHHPNLAQRERGFYHFLEEVSESFEGVFILYTHSRSSTQLLSFPVASDTDLMCSICAFV